MSVYDQLVERYGKKYGHLFSHEELAEVFGGAAALLEKNGWHKGGLFQLDHPNYRPGENLQSGVPMCTGAAVEQSILVQFPEQAVALVGSPLSEKHCFLSRFAMRVAEDYLYSQKDWGTIPDWNDFPGTTMQEVLDFLRDIEKQELVLAEGER